MKRRILRVMSAVLAVVLMLFVFVGRTKQEPDETQTFVEPQESADPQETKVPQESDEVQESNEPQESDEPRESVEPQETDEPQETEVLQETDEVQESNEPQESDEPQETEEMDGEKDTEVEPSGVPTAVIESGSGKAGDEVAIAVELLDGPNLNAMGLKLSFDENALELISQASGEAMKPFMYVAPSRLKDGANFMWYANDPSLVNGTILNLVFKIKGTASTGDYTISMASVQGNTFDENYNDVTLDITNGKITVER